jgi:hypothetical protein
VAVGALLTAWAEPAMATRPSVRPAAVRTPLGAPGTADYNGDSYPDAAVSSLYEDVDGQTDAGAVDVLYGGAGGLQTTAPMAQEWSGDSPGMPTPAAAGDQFGWTLSHGDYNGDGYADLVIAVPHQDVQTESGLISDAGAVDVVFGSAAGLQTASPAPQQWTEVTPGVLGTIGADNNFGRSLATGDFNGDGFADLAIEIRGEDVNSQVDAGGVDVLYGSASGLQTADPVSQIWTQDSPLVEDQAEANDWFGRNLGAGDFNGDGVDDLAAGVFSEDLGTSLKDAGGVEILYGTQHGLDSRAPRGDQFWTQDSPGVKDKAEQNDYFGHTLAAGDFNADGFADLAIASRLEDTPTTANAGAVEILYGSVKGLQAGGPGWPDDQFYNENFIGPGAIARRDDQFGFSLAADDFNQDGVADLAVGAPFKNVEPGARQAGQVAVLYGVAGVGLQTDSPPAQTWNQSTPGMNDMAETGDELSLGMAAGDFNGDGVGDLAIGVAKESLGPFPQAGALAVLYGVAGTGLQDTAPDDQFITQADLGVGDGPEAGDNFGWWVA